MIRQEWNIEQNQKAEQTKKRKRSWPDQRVGLTGSSKLFGRTCGQLGFHVGWLRSYSVFPLGAWLWVSIIVLCVCVLVAQLCLTLCDSIGCSPPSPSVRGILQARTGVGCHCLLQCMKVKGESEVAQLCPTLSDPMHSSLPGSSVHGILHRS